MGHTSNTLWFFFAPRRETYYCLADMQCWNPLPLQCDRSGIPPLLRCRMTSGDFWEKEGMQEIILHSQLVLHLNLVPFRFPVCYVKSKIVCLHISEYINENDDNEHRWCVILACDFVEKDVRSLYDDTFGSHINSPVTIWHGFHGFIAAGSNMEYSPVGII